MYRFRGGWLTKDLYGAVPTVINTGGITWLFRDNFDTARAAGVINGTPSEPSGHTRTLTDSVPNAVITGGQFKVTAIAAARDPWLRYTTGWARVAGRMLRFDAACSLIGTHNPYMGWINTLTAPGATNTYGVRFIPSYIGFDGVNTQIAPYVDGTLTSIVSILRPTGCFIVIGGKLRFIYRADSTATLYVHWAGATSDTNVDVRWDNVGIADLPLNVATLYPTPTLSDTFSVPPIVDYGDGGLHGTPVNVGLNGAEGKYGGGSISGTNIYSAGFNTLFSGVQGTIVQRLKVKDASVWTDAISGYGCYIAADANNYLRILKSNAVNSINTRFTANSTIVGVAIATSSVDFQDVAITWDKTADEFKAYLDGSQSGATVSGLGVWAGAVNPSNACIGASGTSPVSGSFKGSIADSIIANTVASPAQMSTIHTALAAGTLSKATLDGIFGAGNYVWYKHNEQYLSNGLAHVETNTVQALDAGGNALHGTHRNVKLNGSYGTYDAGLAPYTDIYSANLNTKFNGKEGFVISRVRVNNPRVWSGVFYVPLNIGVDANNRVGCYTNNSANQFLWYYTAGGTVKTVTKSSISTTAWFTVGNTFSDATDTFRAFYDGVQEGADVNGIGIWAGALGATACTIGAQSSVPLNPWWGDISDVVIGLNGAVATPAQMADLHTYLTAGTLTADILNTMFGANNWAWYKLDEAVTYPASVAWNGSGHFHNAGGKAYISPTPGAELLTNGSFTAWTADDPDGWTVVGEVGADPEVSEVGTGEGHGGVGTGYCNLYTTGASIIIRQNILASHLFYRVSIDINTIVAGALFVQLGTNGIFLDVTTVGTKNATGRKILASTAFDIKRKAVELTDVTFDNASVKELTLPQCLRACTPASAGEPYQSVKMTITANTQAGGMINLDSYTTPLYGIHWWVDRIDGKLYARKLVNGVWQADSIAGVAVTYSAGAYGEIRRIDDEIYIWYAGAYVGSFQAADVPTTNTLQALFATDSGSYFEADTSYPTGGYDYSKYA